MSIHVALHHRTQYRYEKAVLLGPQVIQLRPAPSGRTPILSYELRVSPATHVLRWQTDALGNPQARVVFSGRADELAVEVDLVADMAPQNPFDFFVEPGFERFPFLYPMETFRNVQAYLQPGPMGARMQALVAQVNRQPQGTVDFIVALNALVCRTVAYTTRMEHGVQTCEETLGKGCGSCRDSAWLLVELCRHLGLAARFVSGYLIQLAVPPGQPGPAADTADLHAWAEVYLPGAGWIGMDATSGLLTAEGHIPLVGTPTAEAAAPISGTVEPAGVEFLFEMTVRRVVQESAPEEATPDAASSESPDKVSAGLENPNGPYTEEQWAKVRETAHRVDRVLEAEDMRLTMGGEPTYVGIDEPESMQWNLDALGPIKRTRGLDLLRCLRERTAPGGLLYFGQGKWYPNEALPRWAFHCISRLDGVPVWEDSSLIATEAARNNYGVAEAQEFMRALTRRLQVSAESILPAFNAAGDAEPAGFCLPLRRRQPDGKLAWSSQLWFPRPDPLVLSWGDSPIGYRIPVEPMPFVAPDELEYGEAAGFPAAPARHPELFAVEPAPDPLPPLSRTAESATELIRPALCVEAREGRLHVFLPYVPVASDYLDLVYAVEDTCRLLGRAIWLEGYPAPHDLRLRTFSLTPDPGVLEVNLPPTAGWDELETTNRILAEEAANNRLIPSKFGFDGSHLATGGGSHIVLGGKTTADSPMLRRPDLLRSMLSFFQNHPSLAYLFSGMYVGPTSQYPRVDEARNDALPELELSFSYLHEAEGSPSTLDGLFRNLLVDPTGNTHRAEFCIDKMYPPEGLGLRLGLLELRAFEMAPHYRMGLLQMLLVRALACAFWRKPFQGNLIRWGTRLHDRFMLPHFVEQDFAEVLAHLRGVGFAFDDEWFAAHREFRFPRIGTLAVEGVQVELRQALEPWNVLAEETTAGGTGRSVDSSLERMQVKVTGLREPGRYVLTCNGRRVPLHATERSGERIAGIRYRARRLYAALHPTIPVHTPLQFDLIDTATLRVVGRCTYFAGPPDGTVHTTRPTSAAEAKARRAERFTISAPPAEQAVMPAEEHNAEFPMTLDLRWPAPASANPAGAAR